VVSCDIVVADESASFAMTPANIGLPYNTAGLLHFTDRLGIGAIKTMFFTAQPVEAEDALRLGLIDQLVPSGRIEAQTRELAMHIAGKAPLAIAAVKEQLRVLSDMRALPASALGRISEIRRRAYQSADFREGIEAFREKRPAVFGGGEG
jgi:methylmalonyl-CoA decarboxylase